MLRDAWADVADQPCSLDHVAASVVPISALTAWEGLIELAARKCGTALWFPFGPAPCSHAPIPPALKT
jgi:hypothetical protein